MGTTSTWVNRFLVLRATVHRAEGASVLTHLPQVRTPTTEETKRALRILTRSAMMMTRMRRSRRLGIANSKGKCGGRAQRWNCRAKLESDHFLSASVLLASGDSDSDSIIALCLSVSVVCAKY